MFKLVKPNTTEYEHRRFNKQSAWFLHFIANVYVNSAVKFEAEYITTVYWNSVDILVYLQLQPYRYNVYTQTDASNL